MGLALVARFAELHDGGAWVEERPGGGASFRVFLPTHPAGYRPEPPRTSMDPEEDEPIVVPQPETATDADASSSADASQA